MDYDIVCSMKVEKLKSYLRLRGLKISGKKEILAARVYCAMENNVMPIKTAEEVEHDINTEYKKKLFINGVELPDPFKLSNGWLSEDEGLTCWPILLYPDIHNYLLFNSAEIASKDLSNYKTCKAYSYFKCGWLEPLFYHQVGIESEYCYLKGNCRKSEKINDPFHKLWIIFNKKTAKIVSAHCTCLAGLSQTCNHVAATLFRIEAAVRNGLTNVACTSSKSEWLPNRSIVAPSKICDLKFDCDEFGRRGRKKRSLVSNEKRNYNPLVNCGLKNLNLTDIAKAIETVAPHSIITSVVPKPDIYYMEELIVSSNVIKPTILTMDDIIVMSDNKFSFSENMKTNMTQIIVTDIEHMTVGQSTNELWFNFRKRVITASKAHDVLKKIEKINMGIKVDMWSLHQSISGLTFVNPDIPALKYGRAMEIEAAKQFFEVMKSLHQNLTVNECGLFLDVEMPYIGGSPDRVIRCSCCPPACLEIKCPFSINHTTPQDPNLSLPFVKKNLNNKFVINKKHRYYTQCQVQMGTAKMNNCYFMVWTAHGYIIDKVAFDEASWLSMKVDFFKYYNDHYLKTL